MMRAQILKFFFKIHFKNYLHTFCAELKKIPFFNRVYSSETWCVSFQDVSKILPVDQAVTLIRRIIPTST